MKILILNLCLFSNKFQYIVIDYTRSHGNKEDEPSTQRRLSVFYVCWSSLGIVEKTSATDLFFQNNVSLKKNSWYFENLKGLNRTHRNKSLQQNNKTHTRTIKKWNYLWLSELLLGNPRGGTRLLSSVKEATKSEMVPVVLAVR